MTKSKLRLAAAVLALSLGAIPTWGDAADTLTPADRAHMNALAQQLGDDNAQSQPVQTAGLFGPSDEDKAAAAAAAQHEQAQDANIATLNQRAGELEDQIRKLTGQIEVLNHRLDEMDQRMDRMKKDFDYRLCTVSPPQPGATPCGGGQTGMPPAAYAPPPDAPPTGVTHLAPPPGVLGTLSQQDAANMPAPQPQPADVAPPAPGSDAHAQFEAAMGLLGRQQYDAASSALRAFADAYPKDAQAPQALYWLGYVAYVQKDYPTAAHTFAEELEKYPNNTRGAESMLKLGQALIAMNQKDKGCTALHILPAKYPGASKTVIAQAASVRKAGGCKL